MQEFTSKYNDKEITFGNKGIRYNNAVFIKYSDMEEVSVSESQLIFRYKGHLIKINFNPNDTEAVEAVFVQPEIPQEVEVDQMDTNLEKFAYLDTAQEKPVPKDEPPVEKKKSKKAGLIIGIMLAVAAVALAAILVLL